MTKADIINEIAKSTGIEKLTVQKTVEAFMENLKTSMIKGNNVYLRGFGSFIVKKRAEKTARNISKNTTIIIPAHYIPAFKPAKSFVEEVSGHVIDDGKGNVFSK
ncbi:MAG: integration host factor subunit beta [Bacteroidetes bacterium RIFOXYA12_FULL_35_11]|nr:MAG: integration host factor subunit beta [Bacteroidetes bacterium GWF2_35_48]OFY81024.1 MAG: integration host factor subunit beta [Bacteroidetes bacterium RIFOXYA12_FULL_35_11]OFY92204.1 MAG: integration host factor subunit beta [Bacteroidetes bacterium RIFOXYB2_FULL_35_7]OFY94743.1 MAG: integration host factor subunit beta [Bacteroidetes bacterium RIFOXYC12_FULL_35_7]HBX49947.1 integration host factor subunit beta [Bacteroidales bacterium]